MMRSLNARPHVKGWREPELPVIVLQYIGSSDWSSIGALKQFYFFLSLPWCNRSFTDTANFAPDQEIAVQLAAVWVKHVPIAMIFPK